MDSWNRGFETAALRLQQALGNVVDQTVAGPTRPVDLGRMFELNRAYASRLNRALSADTPRDLAALLPGRSTMNRLIERMAELCDSQESMNELREAYYAYLRQVGRVASTKRELTELLDGTESADQIRAKGQREKFFYASMELLGAYVEVSSSVDIICPNAEEPEYGDLAVVQAYWGLERTGDLDAVTFLAGASEIDVPDRLPSTRIDSRPFEAATDGSVIREVSSHDLPAMKIMHSNDVVYTTCEGNTLAPNSPFDIASGIRHDRAVRNIRLNECGSEEIITRPNIPTKLRIVDLVVHRDMWPGIKPTLCEFQDSDLPMTVNKASDSVRSPDIGTTAALEVLSIPELQRPIKSAPRHAELIRYLFRHVNVDPDEYRVYRYTIHYPPIGRSMWVIFSREANDITQIDKTM